MIAILRVVHSYAAFIGHQPHISLAELSATVPGFKLHSIAAGSVALFESSEPLPKGFLGRLGGTIVIAERVENRKGDLSQIPQMLAEQVKEMKKGKVTFAFRTVGLSPDQVKRLYRDSKDFLRKMGRSSRYVGNERKPAASVLLHDQGLLEGKEGCEICVIRLKEELWVGMTRDAQDVDAYTKRDIEKPVRDTTVGLLPPKLAQVLLNFGVWLAGGDAEREVPADPKDKKSKKSKRPFAVLDPFCGTGVVPIECLLRGYAVLASDKSEKAVAGCLKNLEWLRKEEKILKTVVPSTVWKQDALKPFSLKTLPDAVVTETSLGPNLRARPTAKDAQALRSEAEALQQEFLKNAAATLPGVPLVVTWPAWYYSKGPLRLEKVWQKLEKLGYEAVLPPEIVSATGSPSLLYRRPEQFVGREIVLLRPIRK